MDAGKLEVSKLKVASERQSRGISNHTSRSHEEKEMSLHFSTSQVSICATKETLFSFAFIS